MRLAFSIVLLQALLCFGGIESIHAQAADQFLPINGKFIANDGFETPIGWKFNEGCPGKMAVMAEEGGSGKTTFVRLTDTSGKSVAILWEDKLDKKAVTYRFKFWCRGEGELGVSFSTYTDQYWIASIFTAKAVKVSDAENWTEVNSVIKVPARMKLARNANWVPRTAEEEQDLANGAEVKFLVPCFYFKGTEKGKHIDIKDLTIEQEQ